MRGQKAEVWGDGRSLGVLLSWELTATVQNEFRIHCDDSDLADVLTLPEHLRPELTVRAPVGNEFILFPVRMLDNKTFVSRR